MIRLLFYLSVVPTLYWFVAFLYVLLTKEGGNDAMTAFIVFFMLSLVLFIVDKVKKKVLDTFVIVLIWGVSFFASWIALMGAAWTGDDDEMFIYIVIFHIILFFLTKSNKKLNKWLKRDI